MSRKSSPAATKRTPLGSGSWTLAEGTVFKGEAKLMDTDVVVAQAGAPSAMATLNAPSCLKNMKTPEDGCGSGRAQSVINVTNLT